ncbi:MAG: SprT family zinc-dependent metalloprotease, partial [Xenophilus sp.]
PSPPGAPARPPARFAHPRASREVRLGDALVAYEFARGRRRTIGFVVGAEGLSVRAPRWVALRDIDAALQEKSAWILRKLAEAQQREARQEDARIVWRDGAALPFLGVPVRMRLDPAHGFAAAGAVLDAGEGGPGEQVLRLALPRQAGAAQIRDAAQAWLMRQARRVFTERLAHFAPQLGVRWTRLSLSSAATRWGSASADGSIRLNWRLIHYRLDIIDYVVVHELAHLRVMDHSPRFWDQVERVLPDYAQRRQVLKDEPAPKH